MIALLDGDLIAYINSASAENDGLEIALARVDKMMRDVIHDVMAEEYKCFISGDNNFRKQINPEYKANRDNKPRPQFLQQCREYLVSEWKASVTDGYEADDALGISQKENTIICSIDKDMRQIPGKHYSWPISRKGLVVREEEFFEVTYLDGLKHFYKQLLIGDTADNIFGVEGIGKVKAEKLIGPLSEEKEMKELVMKLYDNEERFISNANCLWLWRREGEKYSDRMD